LSFRQLCKEVNIADQENKDAEKSLKESLKESLLEAPMTLINIFRAPRALWGINVSYFLEGLVYFGVLTVLGKYMSENVGLSDTHAGYIYSFFTAGITLAMLFLGGIGDKIGVRKALILALCMMVVGRFLLAMSSMDNLFTPGEGLWSPMFWCLVIGLLVVVIGYGTYQPASYAGVKQFTNKKTSTMGYAVIYGLMNLGAFVSGLISPPVRQKFGIGAVYWIFDVLTILAVLAVFVILTKKTVKVTTKAMQDENDKDKKPEELAAKKETASQPTPVAIPAALYIYMLMAVACIAGFVYFIATEPVPPAEQKLTALIEQSNASSKISGEAENEKDESRPELAKLSSSLKEMSNLAGGVIGSVKPPESFNGEVNEQGLLCVSIFVESYSDYAKTIEKLSAEYKPFDLDEEVKITLKNVLRAHGIYTMSIAYSMVADVNEIVVERLRKRFKRPGEDIIPMDAAFAKDAVVDSKKPFKEKFQEYTITTSATADKLAAIDTSGALKSIIEKLRTDSTLVSKWINKLPLEPGDASMEIIKTKMLADAEFALDVAETIYESKTAGNPFQIIEKWVASLLASDKVEDKDEEKSSGPSNITFLSKTIDSFENDASGIKGNMGSVFSMARMEKVVNWSSRYGPWIIGTLLFLFLFLKFFLRARPDHPFNNIRFVYFVFILIPVQTLFAHNWLTLPYYINRAFGGTEVGDWFEFFSNLNPLLIFFLAPLVAALTAKANVFKMMILGTLVMAAPTFLLALPPNMWFFITYILIMSIGEAIWQPRFLQYVAELAPEGKTGIYMGIAQFPWFLTKMVTGFYSGWFLTQYCPKIGPQDTQTMWFIYALIAMISPIALWLTSRWIQKGLSSKASDGL